jgi:hypothetical protein
MDPPESRWEASFVRIHESPKVATCLISFLDWKLWKARLWLLIQAYGSINSKLPCETKRAEA